jgi:hypothetical protein
MNTARVRRVVKATAIGFGVVILGAASLGQASAQSAGTNDIFTEIFGDQWPFPPAGTIVVGESPSQSAEAGGIGEITLGGNSGGSVIMGGGSGGVSIGGGSSSSGGGGGSGNSAG